MELLFLLTCRWNFFLLIQVLYLLWLLFDCTVVPTLDHHLKLLLNPFLYLHIPIFSIKKIFRTCIISHVHDLTFLYIKQHLPIIRPCSKINCSRAISWGDWISRKIVVSSANFKILHSSLVKSSQVKSMLLTDAGSSEPLCPYRW